MPKTLKEMAEIFATAQGRGDAARVWNQLRGGAVMRLLSPCDNRGPKGAHRFDAVEIAAARLILSLIDMGLSGQSLNHVAHVVAHARASNATVLPDGKRVTRSLKAAVSQPGEWILEITLMRKVDGALAGHASWTINGHRNKLPDPLSENLSWPHPVECVLTIPFTKIWRPIAEALEG